MSYSANGSSTLSSSSSLNSSSLVLGLSLGLCQIVCSISRLIGTCVELLDLSPCMKKISLCNYSNFSSAHWNYARSLLRVGSIAMHSIALGGHSITETKCPQTEIEPENRKEKKKEEEEEEGFL